MDDWNDPLEAAYCRWLDKNCKCELEGEGCHCLEFLEWHEQYVETDFEIEEFYA